MFFSPSLKEDLQTLRPVEIGTFSTYLHTHMPKINISPVEICKSSQKVLKKFSELGLKKDSIVRSAVVYDFRSYTSVWLYSRIQLDSILCREVEH
jgi:hypothetical protein